MVHWMDQYNPNRDLSDPNWISAGAYHHEMKKQIDYKRSRMLEAKKQKNVERCYKILQDSIYVRTPDEDPASKIEAFLESAIDCSWEYATDSISKRQFETSFKGWFGQFRKELVTFAKNTPPTMDGKPEPFLDRIGFHTMDDQGFEGQIMNDGSYIRLVEDYYTEKCSKCDGRGYTEHCLIDQYGCPRQDPPLIELCLTCNGKGELEN